MIVAFYNRNGETIEFRSFERKRDAKRLEAMKDRIIETFYGWDQAYKSQVWQDAKRQRGLNESRAMTVTEWGNSGGAGYSSWGGMGGRGGNFGNPSQGRSFYGRGFGFGSSNTGSGSYSMYTYDIKPLNQTLEPQNANNDDGEQTIHVGSVVKGKVLGKKKHIIGQIQKVEMDDDNNIKYYLVREPETTKTHKVDPTSVFIWEPEKEGPYPGAADVMTTSQVGRSGTTRESKQEEFYPRLNEIKYGEYGEELDPDYCYDCVHNVTYRVQIDEFIERELSDLPEVDDEGYDIDPREEARYFLEEGEFDIEERINHILKKEHKIKGKVSVSSHQFGRWTKGGVANVWVEISGDEETIAEIKEDVGNYIEEEGVPFDPDLEW